MKDHGHVAVDLVPLGDRMRMISLFRVAAALLIILGWLGVPGALGAMEAATGVAIVLAWVLVNALIAAVWRWSRRRARMLFGITAMADTIFIAWASYGTAGLDSPLMPLLLLQLITVSLLASFRTGLKLALFNCCLLLSAVYLQEGGVDALGGEAISFGDATYRALAVELAVFVAVAVATTAFAAVNERELRRRRYDLEELARFTLRLEQEETPERVAACLLDGVAGIYDCTPALVIGREGEGLRVLASGQTAGPAVVHAAVALAEREATPELVTVKAGEAPVVESLMSGERARLLAWEGDTDDVLLARFARGASLVVVPLRGAHGEVAGALIAQHRARRGSRIERRVVEMIERFVSHASLALENANLLAEVRALALSDPLTGIANRRQLDQTLERACAQVARGQGSVALLMVDIDYFKKLNDDHGHQAGDVVLRQVARTIERDLRAGDLAARYGGEEFSVVMPAAGAVDDIAIVGERLRAKIEALMPSGIPVTISIGAAWAPMHGTTRDALVAAADAALYRAKQGGRNRLEIAPADDHVAV